MLKLVKGIVSYRKLNSILMYSSTCTHPNVTVNFRGAVKIYLFGERMFHHSPSPQMGTRGSNVISTLHSRVHCPHREKGGGGNRFQPRWRTQRWGPRSLTQGSLSRVHCSVSITPGSES
ncbi:hypothetical protein CEXT_459681 [Caerostris extrusa]|uniref:Uncharacterized protein n=1 Tax=Caerostris extrusa TaxID=172846 RepID=A0AAV4QUM8_CAEEX|nr:hypothetical protein CEXT_459681 [Caerostris extrusa]